MQIFYSLLSVSLIVSWAICLSSNNMQAIKICGVIWIAITAVLSILHILNVVDMTGFFVYDK